MAATRIDAQLHIDAADFAGTMFPDCRLEFLQIYVALKVAVRRQIVREIANDVDNFGAIHIDVDSG